MQRYITGEVTEQEKKKIEAWLDITKTDGGTESAMTDEDEERLLRKILSNANEEDRSQPGILTYFKRYPLRVAACLLLALSAAFLSWQVMKVEPAPPTASAPKMQKKILDDGTIVWMKNGSHLAYIEENGIRRASLTGEALFEVAKNPEMPFVIDCEKLIVKVVGTSFHLKSSAEELELRVLTGTVSLSSTANGDSVKLSANEKAHAVNGKILKEKLDPAEVLEVTGATEYNMAFHHTELGNVLEQIAKKFDMPVTLEDNNAARCRLTADFTDHSLESTLDILAELLDIGYQIQGDTIVITGSGCVLN